MTKLFIYRMTSDKGLAPCVDNGLLSLACCKGGQVRNGKPIKTGLRYRIGSKRESDYEKDDVHITRKEMLNTIMVSLGGRIAEQLACDDITGGAAQDIKDATKVARNMVTRYGMSDKLGMICYADDDDEVFIGRDLAHAKSVSEGTASSIDEEVRAIVNDCYAKAKQIIEEHRGILDECAALLIEKEKITREEFEGLFGQND